MGILWFVSKSSVTRALNISEVALFLFGVVLILGLLGKYQRSEYWKKRVKIFEWMVIIGVAGELWADGAILMFSGQLQTLSELEIARLNRDAAIANKRSMELSKELTRVDESVRRKGPRAALIFAAHLGNDERLKPFHGQRVSVLICSDRENEETTSAGWHYGSNSIRYGRPEIRL
jgi:hypothetical protein